MKEFIDEYKHLEKLCNEIYDQQHGVTQYINEMEQKSGFTSRKIPDWKNTLANLKRVRHIRNNLVHESGYDIDYTQSDIFFMRDFCQRILDQHDPLTLLRKQSEQIVQAKRQPAATREVYQTVIHRTFENDVRKEGIIVKGILMGFGIIALIGLLLWIAKIISDVII